MNSTDVKDLTTFNPLSPEGGEVAKLGEGEKSKRLSWLEEDEKREAGRLAKIAEQAPWPARLPFDLAMELDTAEQTFARYEIEEKAAADLLANADFIATVKFWKEAIVKEGYSYKTKAKLIAEDLLETGYMLATDPGTSDSVRANMVQWFSKVAGYEPKKDSEGGGGQGPGFTLNLTFSEAPGKSAQVIPGIAHRVEEQTQK